MALFTQEKIQSAFNDATQKRYAHFNHLLWLPPWEKENMKPVLEPNTPSLPAYNHTPRFQYDEFLQSRIEQLRAKYGPQLGQFLDVVRAAEPKDAPDLGTTLQQVPHPDRDTSHIHTGVFDDPKSNQLRNAVDHIRNMVGTARKDGEAGKAFRSALVILDKTVEQLAGKNAKGMQRLKLIFEWTLCHVTALFGEINTALDMTDPKQGMKAYTAARDEYIEFLTDLDDHEPETKGPDHAQSAKKGYGRSIKWAYFYPLIHSDDPNVPARIKGVVVVAKWNPHISSSGIPIPHS